MGTNLLRKPLVRAAVAAIVFAVPLTASAQGMWYDPYASQWNQFYLSTPVVSARVQGSWGWPQQNCCWCQAIGCRQGGWSWGNNWWPQNRSWNAGWNGGWDPYWYGDWYGSDPWWDGGWYYYDYWW